jgi:Ca2+-binding EF-hand superfamily protein
LLGKELPADAKEHLATILNTISQIMDADGDGAITESEFITSGRLFLVIANGDSPFHNPDLFFDILDADLSGTVTLQELSRLFSSLLPAGASLGAAATRRRRRRRFSRHRLSPSRSPIRARARAGTDAAMISSIVDEIMAAGDNTGRGSLTREEMRAMAAKLREMFAK